MLYCRAFSDESKAKMGVVECVKHAIVEPFPVLYEKDGNIISSSCFLITLDLKSLPICLLPLSGKLIVD